MYRLEKEVDLIKDPEIKVFVYKCIDKAPSYFWKVPSSSTGKYHPEDERGEGGSVLHTRRAVKVADDLCRNFNINGSERDCVLAAAIMHDFCKNGYPNDTNHTADGHGNLWVNILNQVAIKDLIINSNIIKTISRLIACHMGRFDIPFIIAEDKLGLIIQIADYVVSREYIKVGVGGNND